MSDTTSTASMPTKPSRVGALGKWLDDRTALAQMNKKMIRKVFPDHWSFLLGEVALWSFIVLLITGLLLTLWFKPSMAEVIYNGSYDQLRGLPMSEAYASTLNISFDVRGGLLLRQMHHWSAMLFVSAMFVHMMRVFVTGAYRKPRELNWMIGAVMLLLGIIEGFAGYSLPDDLLSGTGLRIADGLIKSTPIVGSYMSFFIFGGEFPGDIVIPRLYMVHILLIPALFLALIGAHMLLLVQQKHTHWPGPGRTNDNVVGFPMAPIYAAKAGGFFFIVFGITALMGALMSINPVWRFGPYNPAEVTAGSQPDWYMGIAEGLLRIMPGLETYWFGHTWSWNVFLPGAVAPLVIFGIFLAYPVLESWIIGDEEEHHLLVRPRDAPTRTGFLAAMMTVYGLLWAAGGNDVLAVHFHLNLNDITRFMQVAVFVGPVIAFIIARRWAISLQRHDEERVLHGYESGVIMRSPEGGYSEKHLPLSEERAFRLTARDRDVIHAMPAETDAEGIPAKDLRVRKLRARLSSAWFSKNIQKPTREQLEEARAHAEHALEHVVHGHQAVPDDDYMGDHELDGHAADGHQFDGRHPIEGEELRH